MQNKLPTVFLHIGMNKTGSTALQAWFSSHHKHLLQHGIYYPQEGLQGGAHYGLSDVLGFKHGNDAFIASDAEALRSSFINSVQQHNCHKVVYSSENFVINKSFSAIQRFFEGFNCKVIVYLRRHDYWYESAYNQSLKMVRQPNYSKGIEGYIKHQQAVSSIGNYKALIDRWAAIFGKENIIVRSYEKSSLPSGIVADFLNIISATELNNADNKQQFNVSLSKWANAILEVAQRSQLSTVEINTVKSYLQDNDKKDDGFSLLSPARRRIMLKNHLWQYQQIVSEYLLDSKGLFKEPWPDPDEPWQAFVPPQPEEIVSVIIKALQ